MAGLGLMNAVQAYQQGTQFKLQQEQQQRAQAQQAALDEANKAFGQVIEESKSEWARNGAQGQYRPSGDTYFRAAEARGNALVRAGLYDHYMQNEAQIAPIRIKTRAEALQQYELDGDVDKLARRVYPTLFDGKTIVGSERVRGQESEGEGTPGPAVYKFKLSDGTEQVIKPQEFVAQLKTSLIDPAESAKREALLNFERAKRDITTKGQIEVENVRGKNRLEAANVRADAARDVASTRADATAEAAEIRGKYGTEIARIRGDFQSLAARARASGGGRTSDDVQRFKALELAARSSMESIRKELASKEARLKDVSSSERAGVQSAVDGLKQQLEEARGVHSEIMAGMQKPASAAPAGAGLSDAKTGAAPISAPMEQARAEAVSTGQPVQIDIGGRRGTFDAQGGLSDAQGPFKTPMVESGPNDRPSRMPMAGAGPNEPKSRMPMVGASKAEAANDAPPVKLLKEGVRTRFKNGQVWTLQNGKAVKVSG